MQPLAQQKEEWLAFVASCCFSAAPHHGRRPPLRLLFEYRRLRCSSCLQKRREGLILLSG